jgi:hypothetical protein
MINHRVLSRLQISPVCQSLALSLRVCVCVLMYLYMLLHKQLMTSIAETWLCGVGCVCMNV